MNQALFARIAVALFKKPAKSNESEQEEKLIAELEKMVDQYAVSYTHLDVYKRQVLLDRLVTFLRPLTASTSASIASQ